MANITEKALPEIRSGDSILEKLYRLGIIPAGLTRVVIDIDMDNCVKIYYASVDAARLDIMLRLVADAALDGEGLRRADEPKNAGDS